MTRQVVLPDRGRFADWLLRDDAMFRNALAQPPICFGQLAIWSALRDELPRRRLAVREISRAVPSKYCGDEDVWIAIVIADDAFVIGGCTRAMMALAGRVTAVDNEYFFAIFCRDPEPNPALSPNLCCVGLSH